MKCVTTVGLVAALGLCACGGTDPAEATQPPGADPFAVYDGPTLEFSTGEYEIPSGDVFQCFYTDTIATEELAVQAAVGKQGDGGHHITVYYTITPREPQSHPCDDQEMLTWNQVAGAAINPEEFVLDVPPGQALRIPADSQLVLQTHYINTTGAPMVVEDRVQLQLLDPDDVEAYVNDFVVLDDDFEVAPQTSGESVSTCTVQEELQIVRLLGHEHEWGSYFKLEQIDEDDQVVEVIYEHDWEPAFSSAPPMSSYTPNDPLTLTAGTRLRQTCRWNNTEMYALQFPREMCLTYALYFPDDGRKFCSMD